jgi:peptidyl-prolyl cis-trans isomerase C
MDSYRKQILILGAFALALSGMSACEKETPLSQQSVQPQKGQPAAQSPAVKSSEEAGANSSAETAGQASPGGEAGPAFPSRPVDPAAAIATVNGKDVSGAKYYQELNKIMRHGSNIPEDRLVRIRNNILKRLIEVELVGQAITESNIKVSKGDLDKAFQTYRKRFKSDAQFENYLKHGKLTEGQVRTRIEEKKSLEKLIEKQGTLSVSKDEAQAFYEKNKAFYREKESIHARHILLKIGKEARKSEEQKVLARLVAALAEINSGGDFADVARRHSEGPTAPKGGDLGFFGRGQMVKAFEDVVFALEPNAISEPVRTRFGYHLIQLLAKKPEHQRLFEEVEEQIFESLRNKKFFQSRRKLLEKLRKEAKIVRHTS